MPFGAYRLYSLWPLPAVTPDTVRHQATSVIICRRLSCISTLHPHLVDKTTWCFWAKTRAQVQIRSCVNSLETRPFSFAAHAGPDHGPWGRGKDGACCLVAGFSTLLSVCLAVGTGSLVSLDQAVAGTIDALVGLVGDETSWIVWLWLRYFVDTIETHGANTTGARAHISGMEQTAHDAKLHSLPKGILSYNLRDGTGKNIASLRSTSAPSPFHTLPRHGHLMRPPAAHG